MSVNMESDDISAGSYTSAVLPTSAIIRLIGRALCWCVRGAGVLLPFVSPANADGAVQATYAVSLLGVPFVNADVRTTVRSGEYTVHVTYRSAGPMRIVGGMTGEVTSRGTYREGRLIPSSFEVDHRSGRSRRSIALAMSEGVVNTIKIEPPITGEPGQKALEPRHLQAVVDPLSAILLPEGSEGPTPGTCKRTFSVLDGLRRYDVRFEDGGVDAKIHAGFSRPARICNAAVRMVAGNFRRGAPAGAQIAESDVTQVQAIFGRVDAIALDIPISVRATTSVGTVSVVLSNLKADAVEPR